MRLWGRSADQGEGRNKEWREEMNISLTRVRREVVCVGRDDLLRWELVLFPHFPSPSSCFQRGKADMS